ncbi:hypothetical protein HY489_00250 [Candidatus Woesearchaeota archaeon]|nr:hypothetical protein [Candidatus Woesearchaeota archaeon]
MNVTQDVGLAQDLRAYEALFGHKLSFVGARMPNLDPNALQFAERAITHCAPLPKELQFNQETRDPRALEDAALWVLHAYVSCPLKTLYTPHPVYKRNEQPTMRRAAEFLKRAYRHDLVSQLPDIIEALRIRWVMNRLDYLRDTIADAKRRKDPTEYEPEVVAGHLYFRTPYTDLRDITITEMARYQSKGKYRPLPRSIYAPDGLEVSLSR